MQLDFLQQLEEARMTRNDQSVKVLTYADCCERLYLTLLILELLKNFPNATNVVRDYARKTLDVKYERFKMNSTDLYNFIYAFKAINDSPVRWFESISKICKQWINT
jgi:hypothetical protein